MAKAVCLMWLSSLTCHDQFLPHLQVLVTEGQGLCQNVDQKSTSSESTSTS